MEINTASAARTKRANNLIDDALAALAILLGVASEEERKLDGAWCDAARDVRARLETVKGDAEN